MYGVNTGFGSFASTIIPDDKLQWVMSIDFQSNMTCSFSDLQTRLIVSHCAGVGEPLIIERARMMFALRINTLAKGFSGISEETLQKIVAAFNSKTTGACFR